MNNIWKQYKNKTNDNHSIKKHALELDNIMKMKLINFVEKYNNTNDDKLLHGFYVEENSNNHNKKNRGNANDNISLRDCNNDNDITIALKNKKIMKVKVFLWIK